MILSFVNGILVLGLIIAFCSQHFVVRTLFLKLALDALVVSVLLCSPAHESVELRTLALLAFCLAQSLIFVMAGAGYRQFYKSGNKK